MKKKNDEKIYVANASWTPMYNGKDMLSITKQRKLVFVGQEYAQADYIYTNFIYKSDEKYNKNYKIPANFTKIKDFKINNILIYRVYKKIKQYENICLQINNFDDCNIFLYHLTIGHTIYKFQNKIYSSIDKKTVGDFKEKIREEVRNSLKKERILKKEDALLLKELFIKLNS